MSLAALFGIIRFTHCKNPLIGAYRTLFAAKPVSGLSSLSLDQRVFLVYGSGNPTVLVASAMSLIRAATKKTVSVWGRKLSLGANP